VNTAQRYLSDTVATATPARLLVMLYDRLALDLARADAAFDDFHVETIHNHLIHAQEIVRSLKATLRPELWDGAEGLDSIYTWLIEEMMRANMEKDRQRVRDCLTVVAPLQDAWRQAAVVAGGGDAVG
jgi:flagellar protein FliS